MKGYLPLLASGLLSLSASSWAMSLDVQEVGYNIEARGASSVVAELARSGQLSAVANNIKLGDDSWIALAPKLANAGNSHFTQQVKSALSAALLYNPAAVITTVSHSTNLTLTEICHAPPESDSANFQQRAERVLMTIKNSDLLAKRDSCLTSLKQ